MTYEYKNPYRFKRVKVSEVETEVITRYKHYLTLECGHRELRKSNTKPPKSINCYQCETIKNYNDYEIEKKFQLVRNDDGYLEQKK